MTRLCVYSLVFVAAATAGCHDGTTGMHGTADDGGVADDGSTGADDGSTGADAGGHHDGGSGDADGGHHGGGGGGGGGAGGHTGTTIHDVYITWYGFNDNSCQIESQHDCNTIAFPKSDGWPVPHNIATEGKGTFADPITFATAAKDGGAPNEFAPGTRIYVPLVRKYFVMEDQCAECSQEWLSKHSYHVDLWMGPSFGSADGPLTACEDKLTQGETFKGTGTVVADPPSDLPVDTRPLFTNDTCTAHVYP